MGDVEAMEDHPDELLRPTGATLTEQAAAALVARPSPVDSMYRWFSTVAPGWRPVRMSQLHDTDSPDLHECAAATRLPG